MVTKKIIFLIVACVFVFISGCTSVGVVEFPEEAIKINLTGTEGNITIINNYVNETYINQTADLNPRKKFIIRDEFLTNNKREIYKGVSSTGGTETINLPANPQNHNIESTLRLTTSNLNNYIFFRGENNANRFENDNQTQYKEGNIMFQQLSTGAEEYIFQFGWGDATSTSTTNTDSVLIMYDRLNYGTNFYFQTCSSSTCTNQDSGITVNPNTFYILKIEINNQVADFYIDDVLVNSISTNIPASSTTRYRTSLHKTAGTNTNSVFIDFIEIGFEFEVER